MKLNPDCIRAILLAIEESSSYKSFFQFDEEMISTSPLLADYSLDEVLYHLKKCDEAGLLCGAQFFVDSAMVEDLHFRGHEFLENIREPKVWKKAKAVGKEIGTNSVQSLRLIAANVASALIKGYFGLP